MSRSVYSLHPRTNKNTESITTGAVEEIHSVFCARFLIASDGFMRGRLLNQFHWQNEHREKSRSRWVHRAAASALPLPLVPRCLTRPSATTLTNKLNFLLCTCSSPITAQLLRSIRTKASSIITQNISSSRCTGAIDCQHQFVWH